MLNDMPPPSELDIQNGSIYAKVTLQRGFQFGPYSIKWTNEPTDKHVAWEVSKIEQLKFFKFYIELRFDTEITLKEITPRKSLVFVIVFASLTSQHIHQHHHISQMIWTQAHLHRNWHKIKVNALNVIEA